MTNYEAIKEFIEKLKDKIIDDGIYVMTSVDEVIDKIDEVEKEIAHGES